MGTLGDKEIREFCSNGVLISEGFADKNVKQACYELRASKIYYKAYEDVHNCGIKCEIGDDEYILIKPKQCVVVITEESLNIPDNILCRVLTKGRLLSIGLSAVNTYADPGFKGRLGIIFINHSNSYLKIKQYDPIAKIEFDQLAMKVYRPYSGQHGYETGIWPIPIEMRLTEEEIAKDNRIGSDFDEFELSHGKTLASYMRRVFSYERNLFIFSFLAAAILFALLLLVDLTSSTEILVNRIIAIIFGIISSIAASAIILFATKGQKK